MLIKYSNMRRKCFLFFIFSAILLALLIPANAVPIWCNTINVDNAQSKGYDADGDGYYDSSDHYEICTMCEETSYPELSTKCANSEFDCDDKTSDDPGSGCPISGACDASQSGCAYCINPGVYAAETVNSLQYCWDGIDNDCDGRIDCDDPGCYDTYPNCVASCTDGDSDGYYEEVTGCAGSSDCDDNDNLIYPGADEACGSDIDDDDCDNIPGILDPDCGGPADSYIKFCRQVNDLYENDYGIFNSLKNEIDCIDEVPEEEPKVFLASETFNILLELSEAFVISLDSGDTLEMVIKAPGGYEEVRQFVLIPQDLSTFDSGAYLYEEIDVAYDDIFQEPSGPDYTFEFTKNDQVVMSADFTISTNLECTQNPPNGVCCSDYLHTCLSPINKEGETYQDLEDDLEEGDSIDYPAEFRAPCGGVGVCCSSTAECIDIETVSDAPIIKEFLSWDKCDNGDYVGCENYILGHLYYYDYAPDVHIPLGRVDEDDTVSDVIGETNFDSIECYDKSDIKLSWYNYMDQNNEPQVLKNSFWMDSENQQLSFIGKSYRIQGDIGYIGLTGLFRNDECVETRCDFGGVKLDTGLAWTTASTDAVDKKEEIGFDFCGIVHGCDASLDGICDEACAGYGLGDPDCERKCPITDPKEYNECCTNGDDGDNGCCLISNDNVTDPDCAPDVGVDVTCNKEDGFCCPAHDSESTCDPACSALADDCSSCTNAEGNCCAPFEAVEWKAKGNWPGKATKYELDGVCDPDCGMLSSGKATSNPGDGCLSEEDGRCDSDCIEGADIECIGCGVSEYNCCLPDGNDGCDDDCMPGVDPDCPELDTCTVAKDGCCDHTDIDYEDYPVIRCDPDCTEEGDSDCSSCTENGGDCCVPEDDDVCDTDCPYGVDPDCSGFFADPDCAVEQGITCTSNYGDCCVPICDGACDPDCVVGIDPDCSMGDACIHYDPSSGSGSTGPHGSLNVYYLSGDEWLQLGHVQIRDLTPYTSVVELLEGLIEGNNPKLLIESVYSGFEPVMITEDIVVEEESMISLLFDWLAKPFVESVEGNPDQEGKSTPYIAVRTKDGYILDNDFMMGNPGSFNHNYEAGKEFYESGRMLNGDAYLLRYRPEIEEGKIKLRILEYDYEESFMDRLALLAVDHDDSTNMFIKDDFSKSYALNTDNLEYPGSCITSKGVDCMPYLMDKNKELFLEEGEYIDLTIDNQDIRIAWTDAHKLKSIKLLRDGTEHSFTTKKLKLTKAYSHRLDKDLKESLENKDFNYLHTMRGDVVDLEFEIDSDADDYILEAEGFYTDLRAYLYPDVDFDYVEDFLDGDMP